MSDQLLALVPRNIEAEPGSRVSELFWQGNDSLRVTEDADGNPLAFLEPYCRRWIGRPIAEESFEDTDDWTCTSGETIVAISKTDAGGGGVELSEEATIEVPWVLLHDTDLELLRGFFLDLLIYEPEDFSDASRVVLTIEWCGKWRLRLRGNESTATLADVSEWLNGAWAVRGAGPLLSGKFFGQQHRLWIQPLDEDEFLVKNRDRDDYGLVCRTELPVPYDPDEGTEEDRGDDGYAPWGPGSLILHGSSKAWAVFRYVSFPNLWTVETPEQRHLEYLSTQTVTPTTSRFLPDGRRDGESDYEAAMEVFEGDLDTTLWTADPGGQQDYTWRLTATGPADVTIGSQECSYRAVVVDKAQLEWPSVTASDGLTPVDLLALAGTDVLNIREDLGSDDFDARLTVEFLTTDADLYSWIKPNSRWQWIIDADKADTEVDYIRFDGLLDEAEDAPYVTISGEYKRHVTATILKVWRQAGFSIFAGSTPMDGLLRSAAYQDLSKQIPIDPVYEFLAETLADDQALSRSPRGTKPSWLPPIGARILDLLRELRQNQGPKDRLRWVDVDSVPTLYVDQPGTTSVATFYRSVADAVAAGKPAQVIMGTDKSRLLSGAQTDHEFYNDILVIGEGPKPVRKPETVAEAGQELPDETQLITARYQYPLSWTTPANPLYVGARRRLIAVMPHLKTEADVSWTCLALARQFVRFKASGRVSSHLVPTLYPGDVITINGGDDPLQSTADYEIRGIQTTVLNFTDELPAERSLPCVYELGEVPT